MIGAVCRFLFSPSDDLILLMPAYASHAPASLVSPPFRLTRLCSAVALACASVAALPAHAQEQTASPAQALPEVSVTADRAAQAPTEGSNTYTIKESSSAANLPLSPRETPQSISVVTRAKMDDFQLNTINDVLANTTGVTVEKVETDRTY